MIKKKRMDVNKMDYIYKELNQRKENLVSLIEYVKTLTDKELEDIFDNETINRNIKTTIVEIGYERIKRLPFAIFIKSLYYIKNSHLFLVNYKDKINVLSKEELISLIYNSYLDNDCLIELTKIEIFKKYLKEEQESKKDTSLQSFMLTAELYIKKEQIEDITYLGNKIEKFLEGNPIYNEGIDLLINYYLSIVIEKYKEIDLENDINRVGIAIMNSCIKNHKRLSHNMLKFYILFHLKELDLDEYCKEIIVTENTDDKSFAFGDYQQNIGRLRIFTDYLDKNIKFNDEVPEDLRIDYLNLMELQMLSHEFGHIEKHREVEIFQQGFNDYGLLLKNTSIYGWYKNAILKIFLGSEMYNKFHGNFLEEVRADIYSIFDSSIQINKYFKNVFPEELLQSINRVNAKDIIKFYTEEKKTEIKRITPIEKFDTFFKQYLQTQEKDIPQKDLEEELSFDEIINRLLIGTKIPEYVVDVFYKIANGEIITTDIYAELKKQIIEIQCSYNEKQPKNTIG